MLQAVKPPPAAARKSRRLVHIPVILSCSYRSAPLYRGEIASRLGRHSPAARLDAIPISSRRTASFVSYSVPSIPCDFRDSDNTTLLGARLEEETGLRFRARSGLQAVRLKTSSAPPMMYEHTSYTKSLSENRFEAKGREIRRKCKPGEGVESQRDSSTEHGAAVAAKFTADAQTRFSDRL